MQRKIEAVVAGCVPAGEPLELCDWGTVQELHALQLIAREHVAVAITAQSIVVVPIAIARGLLGVKLSPTCARAVEVLPRTSVILEVVAATRTLAIIKLVRRDGSARVVELYDQPSRWRALQR